MDYNTIIQDYNSFRNDSLNKCNSIRHNNGKDSMRHKTSRQEKESVISKSFKIKKDVGNSFTASDRNMLNKVSRLIDCKKSTSDIKSSEV